MQQYLIAISHIFSVLSFCIIYLKKFQTTATVHKLCSNTHRSIWNTLVVCAIMHRRFLFLFCFFSAWRGNNYKRKFEALMNYDYYSPNPTFACALSHLSDDFAAIQSFAVNLFRFLLSFQFYEKIVFRMPSIRKKKK